jgi:hypothetical protein
MPLTRSLLSLALRWGGVQSKHPAPAYVAVVAYRRSEAGCIARMSDLFSPSELFLAQMS